MNSNVIVKKSKIEGIGTFAKHDIPEGEVILTTDGVVIHNFEVDQEPYKALRETCFQYDLGKYFCPVDKKSLNGVFLVNHSCDPNCGIKDRVNLVAIHNINTGEEITFDYAMTDADYEGMNCLPTEAINCQCGSSICRGVISGSDWRKKKLQSKYKDYFSNYIKSLISKK